jgi:hypothetical protein
VPFFVDTASRSGGRRTVTHEFPFRDEPVLDDLGRAARVFTVEGYVLGNDYLRHRDALSSALEDTAGPGALVHPNYGNLRAICTGLTVNESIADGGMARFSIEFSEAPLQVVAPTEEPNLAGDVETSADAALAAVEDELVDDFDIDDQPAFAIESLGAELAAVGAAMGDGLSAIVTDTQELARLDVELQTIASDAASIVRAPADAIAALVDVLRGLTETIAESPRAVLLALLDAYGTTSEALAVGDTATSATTRRRSPQPCAGSWPSRPRGCCRASSTRRSRPRPATVTRWPTRLTSRPSPQATPHTLLSCSSGRTCTAPVPATQGWRGS